MPGKVSAKSSAVSHLPLKSSAQNPNSRKSTASRVSPSTVTAPDEGPLTTLRTRVCSIFSDAQRTNAGHRKLIIGLRKIQESCCDDSTSNQEFSEEDFNVEITRCVIRLMGVRKSEGVGDRIVKFLGLFLRHVTEKDAAQVPEGDADDTQHFPETPSTRLISHILSVLLPLMASKEKTVRFRSTQAIAHVINSLDSIDDEYFYLLKKGLLKRVRDKEPTIRAQAVLALGRLAGNEEETDTINADSDDESANGLLEKLVEILQNDPSADVRRTLLLNLPLTPGTLPFLLERARDLDAATRRTLYSRLLPALGDFRHLSLSMREKLLRWGFRDRDENVRKATARLFRERWIEDCAGAEATENAALVNVHGLLELLERIDVVNSGVENGVALEAMKEFWNGRPDYREAINFDDPFWDHLTPESVFMVRSFNDFCKSEDGEKIESMAEEKIPEVTKLAFFLQRYINDLVDCLRRNTMRDESQQEVTIDQEFIVEQLLHIVKTLDYSDEVGRRKMFTLLRETLAIAELPDEITRLVVNVFRDICGVETSRERDFCSVVLEAVAEVHDTILADEMVPEYEDESFHSAQSEISDATLMQNNKKETKGSGKYRETEEDESKAIKEILINMKCLHIAQCMLQNVEGNLQQNLHLVTTLNNLVVPAVRSHEAPIRERGLLCLGLCCLLDRNLAEENITLFLHCYNKGHEALQVTALHVLSDILTTHPTIFPSPAVDATLPKSITKTFSKALKAADSPDVQAAGTVALCKLMLTNVIQDEDLLKQAVVCFFDPATKGNPAVRQALSYFLPVYCHSRRENMERMAYAVPGVLHAVLCLEEELSEEEEITSIGVVGSMLVDWTDARKLVVQNDSHFSWDEAGRREIKAVNGDIHLDLAEKLLEKVMSHGCTREEKKAIIPLFGKLYLTASSTPEKLISVHDLVVEAIDMKVANDAASRNGLNKMHLVLVKLIGEIGTAKKGTQEETIVDSVPEEVPVKEMRMEETNGDTKVEDIEGVTEAHGFSKNSVDGEEEEL